jgi:hypothetical protein
MYLLIYLENKMKTLKVGDKINIDTVHLGYNGKTNKSDNASIVWVVISDATDDGKDGIKSLGCGYIENRFSLLTDSEGCLLNKERYSGTVVSVEIMEHSNGGRSNQKIYSSFEEYCNDPIVKHILDVKAKDNDGELFFTRQGDPEHADVITTFSVDNFDVNFAVNRIEYDVIPEYWYNEFYSTTVAELALSEVFSDADEAIVGVELVKDLFGDRFFPVVRAPLQLKEEIFDICGGFKAVSKPLTKDDYVFFGLRCASNEINDLSEIYKVGGCVLKDRQWDW